MIFISARIGSTLCIGLAATLLCSAALDKKMPAVGDKAPLVQGADQDGKTVNIGDIIGKQILVLYFYPKDNTPGCTLEACGWRDSMEQLKSAKVSVIGVSFDSAESHKAFQEQHKLNFTLISDPDGKIADAFGARKASDAKTAKRVSFLIDRDGKIAHITDTPSAAVHLQEIKAAIERLK